jgi:hypothetical protein
MRLPSIHAKGRAELGTIRKSSKTRINIECNKNISSVLSARNFTMVKASTLITSKRVRNAPTAATTKAINLPF